MPILPGIEHLVSSKRSEMTGVCECGGEEGEEQSEVK